MDFNEMSFMEAICQVVDSQKSEKLKDRINNYINLQVEKCDEEDRSWADFIYHKQDMFLNPYDGVHGGMACLLADTCMGMTTAAATQALPSTTDLQVSYLSPMQSESFRIHAEIKRAGKQLAGCICEIYEADTGRLCITAMGKYILIRKDILADKEVSKLLPASEEN